MRWQVVYMLVAVLLSSLGVGLGVLTMSRYQQAENDRRWCSLLTDLDAAYQAPPGPASELGQKVGAEIHRLRVGFGCPQR